MIQREALKFLRSWRNDPHRKPLVLRGARQVGKTTIINEFAREFDSYLYLNMELAEDRRAFELEQPINDMVDLLFARKGIARDKGETLMFIDEIQQSPRAMAMLRYLYEKLPQLHVVAAGSLLENVVDIKASFPVGRVDYLPIRPCSFCEFLSAINRAPEITEIKPELTRPFHAEYMALFNQYCIVGGMPEVVQYYADTHDMVNMDRICAHLLRGYLDDVEKYCRGNILTDVVRFIIQHGWNEAGAIVTLGGFGESQYKSREVGEAFQLLRKAMMVELVHPSTSAQLPAIPEMKRMPKLFWFDTGMVNYAAGIRKELIGANDILDVWRGRIGEQIVAQELLATSNDINSHRSFWSSGKGKSGAEVDLTWIVDSKLIPIEVKTGHNAHLKSLHSFMDASPIDVAVRVWSGPFSVDNVQTTIKRKKFRLINLPFYLVWNIENIVRKELERESGV